MLDDEKRADEFFPYMGRGLDTGLGMILSPVLTGPVIQASHKEEPTSAIFELITSQHAYSDHVARSASASGLFKKISARGGASVEKFYSSNSYSLYLIAHARIPQHARYLDINSASIKVDPAILRTMRKFYKQPNEILREVGNEIITKAVLLSELLIVIEITTSSEEDRKVTANTLSANYVGVAAGKHTFSSIQSQLSTNRRISFNLYGDIGSGFISTTDPDEAEQALFRFLEGTQPARLVRYESTPISNINQLKGPNIPRNIVNVNELIARSNFASQLNARYLYLADWKNDISYVLANPAQFGNAIVEEAYVDKNNCEASIRILKQLAEAAGHQFVASGLNGEIIKPELLPIVAGHRYRREPNANVPAPQREPRPEPPYLPYSPHDRDGRTV